VFPLILDTDHPEFRSLMERLRQLSDKIAMTKASREPLSSVKRAWLFAQLAITFLRLYVMPVQTNVLPDTVRLVPAW
jgi:magnesium-protoporphyrin IX monomethyl ester (oxidative) cyclase